MEAPDMNHLASDNRVEIFPKPPQDLNSFSLNDIEFGEHALDVDWKRNQGQQILTIRHKQRQSKLDILFRIAMNGDEMFVDDKSIVVKKESYRGIMTGIVNISLTPSDTVTIRINE